MAKIKTTPSANLPPEEKINVEVVLDDTSIPYVGDVRILVLPTGERVLVMTGNNGLATCCLLPPRSGAPPSSTSALPSVERPGSGSSP